MKILLIIIIIIFIFVIFRFLFVGNVPKYTGISLQQLQGYISYLSRTLRSGGYIIFELSGYDGPMKIRKKEYKMKPNELLVELASGYHNRENLINVSQALTNEKIDHKLTYTKKNQLVKCLTVPIQTNSTFVPSATSHVIDIICNALGGQETKLFSLTLHGPFKYGFLPEDGEIIKHSTSTKVGYFTGRVIGSILRVINKKGT